MNGTTKSWWQRMFGSSSNGSDGVGESADAKAQAATAGLGADEWIAKGHALEDAQDIEGARQCYRSALDVDPASARAWLNLGNAQRMIGTPEDAEAAYRRALELRPNYAEAHQNLGILHLQANAFEAAAGHFREAIRLRGTWVEAQYGLGCAQLGAQRQTEAEQTFRAVLIAQPGHALAATQLAALLGARGHGSESEAVLQSALNRAPESVTVQIAMADLRKGAGDCVAATQHYRHALELASNGGPTGLASSYLFSLLFLPEISNESLLSEHLRIAQRFERDFDWQGGGSSRADSSKIRIGYLSSDFRRHPMACFMVPVLRNHDREGFEVFCYFNHRQPDELTERIRMLSEHWRDVAEMDDLRLAEQIRTDGIDVLVDLNGHTTGHRLEVIAMCPARIHCTWLGYLATTGLQAMDFRLCDALTDPPGQAEAWQSEKPLRMPDSQWCYEPQVSLPECSVLPYSRKGCWTFGSFNQGTKINGEVLRAWAACLLAIPGSRLLVHGVTESLLTDRIGAAMASHGIGPERYEVRGRTSIDEYFVAFQEVDVALDTFPYNGGTTTCDALIMGVPVATVCGARSVSRGGLSILSTIGLKHWIADCVADLPEMLVRNLDNVEEMARLRAGLRERMQASALMDAPKFVRNLEHLLAEALNAPP